MSWLFESLDRMLAFVDEAVAGGYVLALGLICVVQYLMHVHRLAVTSRQAEQYRGEINMLQDDYHSVQRDRTLSRLENSILREFVAQTEISQALEMLMRRFVPNTGQGFGAFIRWNENCEQQREVYRSRGLSLESRKSLMIDDELLRQVMRERVLVLEGYELHNSKLLWSLSAVDRRKVRRLNLAAVGDADDVGGVLVTTSLYPPGAPQEQQIELTRRLMQSIAIDYKMSQALDQQKHELQSTSEILLLRSIADGKFDSPLDMIREFLSQLMQKVGADRATLYLLSQNSDDLGKPLVRCGVDLESGVLACWQAFEDRLAGGRCNSNELVSYSHKELKELGIETIIGGAMVAPLAQKQGATGIVCFTKGADQPFSAAQISLATWATQYLADMIQKLLSQAIVKRQAGEDGLTELANRRSFDQQIKREIQWARQDGQQVSLLLFDLDRFKSINDTFGHQAGDAVLRKTAQILKDQVRASVRLGERVLVARYGGEEMAVLFPNVNMSTSTRIGESIRQAIEAEPFHFQGQDVRLTVSVGVASFPNYADNVHELISAADAALYQAKETGRNRVVTADNIPAEQVS